MPCLSLFNGACIAGAPCDSQNESRSTVNARAGTVMIGNKISESLSCNRLHQVPLVIYLYIQIQSKIFT